MRNILVILFFLCLNFLNVTAQGYQEPLAVGALAPEISVQLSEHENFLLSETLKESDHVVLIFYRGSWCGYCQKHMSALQDSLPLILEENTSVIVITPETISSIGKMQDLSGASFNIVHDKDYAVMKAYHVDYVISSETVPKYTGPVTKRTAEANGNEDGVLPVPATYIIGKDQKIEWVHFDPKYSERSTIAEILEVIK